MLDVLCLGGENQPKGIYRLIFLLKDFMSDMLLALRGVEYIIYGSYSEIKSRYKSSYLGPFWITLSNVIFIGFISIVYSQIFNIDIVEYVPYLTVGYLLWLLILTVLLDGSGVFVTLGQVLRDHNTPPIILYCRVYCRSLIIFAHNLPVMFFVVFYFQGFVTDIPMFMFGLFINMVCLFFLGLSLSVIACRFRDIYYILPSVFQVLILIMPILWKPDMLVGRKMMLVDLNVLYQLLELARAPFLGQFVPAHYYFNSLMFTLFCFISASLLYSANKRKLIFWS